jgi:chitinase
MYFTGTFDTRWDNGILNPAFNLLKASDFEVVQLGWQPPQSTLSVADAAITEGNSGTSLLTFTATLSQASASTVTFNATSANGTATAGSDFVALSASGLSIPAGQLTKTFTVTINGDTAIEANETFLVNLGSVVGAGVGDGQAVGTITNDDGAKLSINNLWLAEGNSGSKSATFTVSLSEVSGAAVTVTAATANGTATSGSDYTAKTSGLTIPAGQLSTLFSVTTAGDLSVEPNESFFVNLSAASNATILDGQGQGTILNDDGVALSVGDVTISEGDAGTKQATFTVQLTKAATVPVTYTIATANGTAAAGSDYVAKTLTGETIPAGQIMRTFSVTLNGDTAVEADETFAVNLSAATGATILDAQGMGTIGNDDTPTVSIADVQLAEGNAGTKTMTFTVQLSKAVGVPVTYNIATANATASAGSDYVAKALVGETIAAGQTSRTFTVTLNGDTTAEANEWFTVTLASVSGVAVADGQALGVLVNDEGPTLSVNDVGTSEGNLSGKVATFTVTLSQVSAVPVTFTATTANSTALAGYDYIGSTQTNLEIPAGQLSRTVEVVIYSDNVVEPNEYFKLNLSAATGATIAKASGFMTLVNDDGPLLRINDVAISEGNAGTKVLNFTVSLAPVANGPVSFDIATVNGTAAAGTDYVANALVGETIAAGVGSKTFAVTLNGDTSVEANETIKVNLTNAVGATIYDSQGLGTITNDD